MAKITLSKLTLEKYAEQMNQLAGRMEGICKYSIYDAADLCVAEIRKRVPVSDDPRTQGDLRDSFKPSPFKNDNGFVYTTIFPDGYDHKGAPMPLVARTLESGRSDGKGGVTGKHEFMREAKNACTKRAKQMIEENFAKKIEETMNKMKG